MAFLVQANRKGWIFETIDEARAAASFVQRQKGVIVGIVETDKAATHKID